MTADVALTLGDPNGIGPENRNQGGFASGGDRQDISRSDKRPHVIEHYMQLLDYVSAAIRFVEQGLRAQSEAQAAQRISARCEKADIENQWVLTKQR